MTSLKNEREIREKRKRYKKSGKQVQKAIVFIFAFASIIVLIFRIFYFIFYILYSNFYNLHFIFYILHLFLLLFTLRFLYLAFIFDQLNSISAFFMLFNYFSLWLLYFFFQNLFKLMMLSTFITKFCVANFYINNWKRYQAWQIN